MGHAAHHKLLMGMDNFEMTVLQDGQKIQETRQAKFHCGSGSIGSDIGRNLPVCLRQLTKPRTNPDQVDGAFGVAASRRRRAPGVCYLDECFFAAGDSRVAERPVGVIPSTKVKRQPVTSNAMSNSPTENYHEILNGVRDSRSRM
jgi:hypothetical protein